MDLVASYDSDVDDGLVVEEINAPPKVAETSKTIDVIEIDSESDNDSVSAVKENSSITPACPKELSGKSKIVDCIDLEDDDDVSTDTSNTRQNETLKFSSEKKIDYLNLEDSDSDDERGNTDKNMSSLMEVASTLSSMPYGPHNSIEKSKHFSDNSTFEKDLGNVVSVPNVNSDVSCSSARNTPEFAQSNVSCDSMDSPDNKRFKGNASILASFQNNTEGSVTEKNVTHIYRGDERVIEASKKNVACRIPRQIIRACEAHSSVITSLSWCIPKFSYLFLSSSIDCSIKIWDLNKVKPVQCIRSMAGINAAKWSLGGGQIVAGGYGEKTFVLDVETGKKIVAYDIYNIITSLEIHPYMEDVFLCGTRNAILGYDLRVNSIFPIRSFFSKCEEVLDIAFLDENEFICSTSLVSHDSADRTIMAWDFSSGAKLSNQIYLERFTCPSLKVHPTDSVFLAQSNGNYIASFSTSRPYKEKQKTFRGHKVSGYGIEFDISPDGKYLASGDAEGKVYFYNYATGNPVHCSTTEKTDPTNRVKWHPTFSSTLITATYNGCIQIWK